jgi:hypothetical protein
VTFFCKITFTLPTHTHLGPLRDMANRAASSGDCDRDCFLHWMRKEISLSWIRGNARVFRRYLGQLIRGTGTDFQPGADVPTLGD